jgi:nitrous oxide reductase accessory protein NosL
MCRLRTIFLVAVAMLFVLTTLVEATGAPPSPGPKERCAVCGMFVAKYPNWVAIVAVDGGSLRYFDGPKDLFRFLARDGGQVTPTTKIWVTDYYTTTLLDARDAIFVIGSDVLGPMGAELIPHASVELAESFRADHGGEPPLAFEDVDANVLGSLE